MNSQNPKPSEPQPPLTVGRAQEMLRAHQGHRLDHEDVVGVGIGLRDGATAFVVTVESKDGRARYERDFPETHVGGLPVQVEISMLRAGVATRGHVIEAALLPSPPTIRERVRRFFLGLTSLLAP